MSKALEQYRSSFEYLDDSYAAGRKAYRDGQPMPVSSSTPADYEYKRGWIEQAEEDRQPSQ